MRPNKTSLRTPALGGAIKMLCHHTKMFCKQHLELNRVKLALENNGDYIGK